MSNASAATAARPAGARKEFPNALPLQRRFFDKTDLRLVKNDDGYVRLSFPCASETPIERWYGDEVLSHDPSAIRMQRIKRGAVMYLFNHNWDDPIGVVEDARIENRRLVVDVRFFKTARAAEVAQMIDDGLRNVSLMYRMYVVEEDTKKNRFTITDWEPYEVSCMTVPADATVGVGRSQDEGEQFAVRMVRPASDPTNTAQPADRSTQMDGQSTAAAGASAATQGTQEGSSQGAGPGASGDRGAGPGNGAGAQAPTRVQVGAEGANRSAMDLENARVRAIDNIVEGNAIPKNIRDLWVSGGADMEVVSRELLAILKKRGETNPQSPALLGLTERETQQFSIRKAILAVRDQNWGNAGFEARCSQEIAQKLGKVSEPNKFYVPYEVQQRAFSNPLEVLAHALNRRTALDFGQRDLTVATAGAGGFLVATQNMGFIELLRNVSVMLRMGTQRLTGLQGNVTIPKQTVAGTAFWLANEGTSITESQQTFVQVAMSPKTVGGYTEISRQLLLQSNPSAEGLVLADLAAVVGLAIDLAGLSGSGAAGQPLGILNTAGIGSVLGTALDYADIIEFLTDTFAANALFGASGFVAAGTVAGLLMQRVKFASTASPIWEGQLQEGSIQGYRAMASNQMAAATMLFGNFGTTILAEWGVLEIEVNPFANFQAGIVGVRAIASVDYAVRYPTAFSAASAIT